MRMSLVLVVASLAAACAQTPPPKPAPKPVGMANPASVHCVDQGGKLEIRETPAGQQGMCRLPDGRVCEEWALYRDKACVDPRS